MRALSLMPNPFDTPERKAFRESLKRFAQAGAAPWKIRQKRGAMNV